MKTEILTARPEDFDAIKRLYDAAREYFRLAGIDQWQTGYPQNEVVLNDIASHFTHAVWADGRIIAACAIIPAPDPSYARIDGAWLTGGKYTVIHRVAVLPKYKGRGIASLLFSHARDISDPSILSLRADTHEDNLSMQRLLEKNGFVRCGIITLYGDSEAGKTRIAYEKLLTDR